jgi:hypothetical protein
LVSLGAAGGGCRSYSEVGPPLCFLLVDIDGHAAAPSVLTSLTPRAGTNLSMANPEHCWTHTEAFPIVQCDCLILAAAHRRLILDFHPAAIGSFIPFTRLAYCPADGLVSHPGLV